MSVGDTQAKVDFASRLSKDINVNFYTALGWEQAEGGPSGNPLNVRPGTVYGTPTQAADATAAFLTTEDKAGFYAGMVKVFGQKFATPDAEIAAEANAIASNAHFNTSPNKSQYDNNIRSAAATALFERIQPNSKIDAGGNIQNTIPDPLGGGILGGAEGALSAIGDFFSWITSGENVIRIVMVLGGGVAIILGAYRAVK
jgi:hypothetical protein